MDEFLEGVGTTNKYLKRYESEEEYRADHEAWSSTKVKDFIKRPLLDWRKVYVTREKKFEPSDEMNFGSLVDCLSLEPHRFDEKFFVSSVSKPTPNNLKFIENLLYLIGDDGVIEEDYWERAYDMAGIKSPKFPGFIKKFNEGDAAIYLSEILESKDKIVVTTEDIERAERCKHFLFNSTGTAEYFSEMECHYQVPLKAEIEGEPIRGMLDIIAVDHKGKKIYPIDAKAVAQQEQFTNLFFKLMYYVQQGLYTPIVEAWAAEKMPGYEVMPFQFFAIDSGGFSETLVYEILPPEGQDFLHTFTTAQGKTYKSGLDIIKDIKWHLKEDKWTIRKNHLDNNGKINIQL